MADPASALPFAVLRRLRTSDEGTFGLLRLARGQLMVGELPWRNNDLSLSCIPPGRYQCQPAESESRGTHFHLLDVPGRSCILIHAGYWCGDAEQGRPTSTHGGLLLGMAVADLGGSLAMRHSHEALHELTCYAPHGLVLYVTDDTAGQWAGGRHPAKDPASNAGARPVVRRSKPTKGSPA